MTNKQAAIDLLRAQPAERRDDTGIIRLTLPSWREIELAGYVVPPMGAVMHMHTIFDLPGGEHYVVYAALFGTALVLHSCGWITCRYDAKEDTVLLPGALPFYFDDDTGEVMSHDPQIAVEEVTEILLPAF